LTAPTFDPARVGAAARRGLLTVAISTAVLAVVAVAVARSSVGAEARALWTTLQPASLAAAFALISLAFVFMALRWRSLMPPPHHPPVGGLTAIICAGLLLNYAVPGPMGEVGAAWFAHRRYGLPLADALASGVVARLIGLLTSGVLALLVWAACDLPVPEPLAPLVGGAAWVVGLGALVGAAVVGVPEIPAGVAGWLERRWGQDTDGLGARLRGAVMALAKALAAGAARGTGPLARAALWSTGGHCCVIAGILVAAGGMGLVPSVAGLAFTYAMTTVGAVALFALPGSQLGWDALFFSLLVGTAGLPAASAAAVALLVRVQQLCFMGVGGALVPWLLRQPGAQDAG